MKKIHDMTLMKKKKNFQFLLFLSTLTHILVLQFVRVRGL